MKKFLSILLALMMFLPAALSEGTLPQLTHDQVKERMEANPYLNLIDIRAAEEYDGGHLRDAMNIPLDILQAVLQQNLDAGLNDMGIEIILYGEDAAQCRRAGEITMNLGFTNVSYMDQVSLWPYSLVTTAEDHRILGGMEAADIYGRPVTEEILKDYRLTMVNVWATYCNPCITEMKELAKLAKEMEAKGVQIIGIVSDALNYDLTPNENNIHKAREIAETAGADFYHIIPDIKVAKMLLPLIEAVPTTFFLDQNGIQVGVAYSGARNYDQWKKIVESMLDQLDAQGNAQ